MDSDARGFPLGDLRVSDAERDRAVSELSLAYQAGRITVEEFDQRSTQALSARTGRELTATVADLPLDQSPVDVPADNGTREDDSDLVPWLSAATSLTAICFADVAVMSASQPGVDWTGALIPAAISVLFVLLVIVLRLGARRAARLPSGRPERFPGLATQTADAKHHRGPAGLRGGKSSGLGGATVRSRSWVLGFDRGGWPQ